MNKVILSLFVLAGALCLVHADCDNTKFTQCSNTATQAIAAAGGDVTKMCAALKTFEDCTATSGCTDDPVAQITIDMIKASVGAACGSSAVHVSILALVLALIASYFTK